MNFRIFAFIVCCFFSFPVFSQNNYSVQGVVIDTTTNAKIDDATVSVISAKDSILQKFTYTKKGVFGLNNLKPGKFVIMVTYPDYADFVEQFTLDAAKPRYNFGSIRMILQSKLLNEVIIKARVVAIKIKGDTTEFNAAAYATQKNAKVEDLLKQLQGMKINQSGVIIFQGEPVSKVLVDGEEFFSDDPALVTKNLRADMVSKVQVYDQKSEQAKLTGIEDGVKVKTINIVLLEDKKKGLFGKAEGGYGTDDFYYGQLMFNKFSPKQKFSAYGNLGNTGKVGLSGADNNKFGSGYSQGDYGGNGIPLARDAGAHYDSKWNQDKHSVNMNYKAGALTTDGERNSLTQNNLPGNFNRSTDDRTSHSYSLNQGFNGSFSSKLDSTSDFSAYFNGYKTNSNNEDSNIGSTVRGNGILQNASKVLNNDESESLSVTLSASYIKRLKKKGRSLSLNVYTDYSEANRKGYLKSDVNYFNEQGVIDSTNTIDQYKPSATRNNGFTTSLSYTDVITKALSVSTTYAFARRMNDEDRRSFNSPSASVYDQLDSAFSSEYRLITLSNIYSLNLSYSAGKVFANASTSITNSEYEQKDLFAGGALNRNFLIWRPAANFRYQLSKAASLSFDYTGNTRTPYLAQLQPLRQNSDPLNITLGNPALRPQFDNRFSYYYRVYQPTLDQGINFRGSYGTSMNAIVSNRLTDSAGINTLQYSNLKGKNPSSWNVYAEVYGHATKLDFILYISTTINGSTYFNYVNNKLNKISNVEYKPQVDIAKNKTTYSYGFSIGPNYTASSSSLQSVDNNTKGFFSSFNFYTKLPYNFFIGSDLNYKYNAKNKVFDRSFEQLLVNSYIGKSFLKEENLKLTLRGNDLLNQNTGYRRDSSTSGFIESRNTTIKRYFIFSLTWDYTKFGKSLQKQQS
ncbi:MAG TPA: TonB-dependent receptor [Pedobacter sp.]|uniref:TonB-dependent receptor n=1 Tax=Pedobacter sp. TaxID=1411316 RepID=UPI002BE94727|nr:TonB-dependent receptor [Pedobacter sp.]HMI02205.1 TonB-dependent receptor [Pedobacter sp.]